MNSFKDFAIVIPCYNEATAIKKVLENLIELEPGFIIVVDDCSTDNSREVIQSFEDKVILLKTPRNTGGPGLPLKMGIKYASKLPIKYITTVDADNQHSKEDTKKVMEKMAIGDYVMVSGARIFNNNIPASKKISNFLVKAAFIALYGINAKDPFCGLRCYSKLAVKEIKFEHGFQWLVNVNRVESKYKLRTATVGIKAIYTEYSLNKGLNLRRGLKVFERMIAVRLKELTAKRRFVRINYELNA